MPLDIAFPLPTPPRHLDNSMLIALDLEIDVLLRVPEAREKFGVDGSGLAVAVLDTGLRISHECFIGRVLEGRNFTADNNGDPNNVSDHNGHGTNVAGIVAAGTSDERRGIAPGANIVPLKVLPASNIQPIVDALNWVVTNSKRLGISVVNLSVGAPGINLTDDAQVALEIVELNDVLDKLVVMNVPVVVAAGNSYFQFQTEGMSIPAIFRQVIAVGAVYDASFGSRSYQSGAIAHSTHADQIAPFSQRLARETSPECYTDVFSAGGAATSAGSQSDTATSVQDGTSQAAPTITGIVLLLQQYFLRRTGRLPSITILQEILRSGSVWVTDGDDEDDNVKHSNRKFPRVNALEAIVALHKAIQLGRF